MAKVLLDAFRGHDHDPDGVWIFDAVAQELGNDGAWFQVNVTASFRFQEVPA